MLWCVVLRWWDTILNWVGVKGEDEVEVDRAKRIGNVGDGGRGGEVGSESGSEAEKAWGFWEDCIWRRSADPDEYPITIGAVDCGRDAAHSVEH